MAKKDYPERTLEDVEEELNRIAEEIRRTGATPYLLVTPLETIQDKLKDIYHDLRRLEVKLFG